MHHSVDTVNITVVNLIYISVVNLILYVFYRTKNRLTEYIALLNWVKRTKIAKFYGKYWLALKHEKNPTSIAVVTVL